MSKRAIDTRALIEDFARDRARDLPLLGVLVVMGGLLELVGLLLLIPLLAIVAGDSEIAARVGLDRILGDTSQTQRLVIVAGLFLAAMLCRSAVVYWRERTRIKVLIDYLGSLRARYLCGLVAGGWRRDSALGESGLHRNLFTEAGRCMIAASYAVGLASVAVLLAIQGSAALILSPRLSLVALALLALGMALGLPFARASRDRGAALTAAMVEASERSGNLHQAFKRALAEGSAQEYVSRFVKRDRALHRVQFDLDTRSARGQAIAGLLAAVAVVILLVAGSLLFDIALPVLVTLIVIFARLSGPARQAIVMIERMSADAPAFAALAPLAAAGKAPVDPPELRATSTDDPAHWQTLELRAGHFDLSPEVTVGPIEFSLGKGEWVGLEGPSGSGKTTLLDALAGLVAPSRGALHLDGRAVDLALHPGWPAQLAYVGQGELPVGQSLRETLQLPDDFSQVELERLLETTGLDEVMRARGLSFDQPLGVQARGLSGGEAQRVAIARALARRPRLLLLDEATASLDLAAERALFGRLTALEDRPAIVMVAHREASLSLMDRRFPMPHW